MPESFWRPCPAHTEGGEIPGYRRHPALWHASGRTLPAAVQGCADPLERHAFKFKGKRDKIRFVPVHPMVLGQIAEYREMLKRGGAHEMDVAGPLFRPVASNRTGTLERHLDSARSIAHCHQVGESRGAHRSCCLDSP
jgi:hypothetical protein